tara:strand:+ start:62309 stop:62680 length:372 start_codon:yes stop_codon:yes gene_type:complete
MKIYKISQEIIDQGDSGIINNRTNDGDMLYYDVGHNYKNSNENDRVWMLSEGKLETSDDIGAGHDGWDLWQSKPISWSGRYDDNKKIVSVSPPSDKLVASIPNILVRMLRQKFPNAKKFIIMR